MKPVGGRSKLGLVGGSFAAVFLLALILVPSLINSKDSESGYLGFIQFANEQPLESAEAAVIPVDVRQTFTTTEKTGDGKADKERLMVDSELIDPDNHCEFCYMITYEPGDLGKAGTIWKSNKKFDLDNAQRLTLFAKGEKGGEEVSFSAAGKLVDKAAGVSNGKELKFSFTSEKVKLDSDWKRYDIDVSKLDLKGITHGFGLEISEGKNSGQPVVIYLKGIIYDSYGPTSAIPAAQSN